MALVSSGSVKPGEDRHEVAGSLRVAVLSLLLPPLLLAVLSEGLLARAMIGDCWAEAGGESVQEIGPDVSVPAVEGRD
jgi:hypothetical protein